VEQPVDFQFAQTELMMNEIGSGAYLSEFDTKHLVGSLPSILLMQVSSISNDLHEVISF